MKNKRILALRGIGMALITLAVIFGICALGCVGGIEQGGSILRGMAWCGLFGIGSVVCGKVGMALCEV